MYHIFLFRKGCFYRSWCSSFRALRQKCGYSIGRAERAGFKDIVLTIDTPILGQNDSDIENRQMTRASCDVGQVDRSLSFKDILMHLARDGMEVVVIVMLLRQKVERTLEMAQERSGILEELYLKKCSDTTSFSNQILYGLQQ